MTERHIPSDLRRLVIERAGNRCEYCRYPGGYSPQSLSLDHLTPRHHGGGTSADNLALSCQGCNSHKAARTTARDSLTDAFVALFNPRTQRWRDHFAWSLDYYPDNRADANWEGHCRSLAIEPRGTREHASCAVRGGRAPSSRTGVERSSWASIRVSPWVQPSARI